MGNRINVCAFGTDEEVAMKALIPTLGANGYSVVGTIIQPDGQRFMRIDRYGLYKVIFTKKGENNILASLQYQQ
jgi:hypothetical protein